MWLAGCLNARQFDTGAVDSVRVTVEINSPYLAADAIVGRGGQLIMTRSYRSE